MQCKRRKTSSACLIDCAGIGDALAVMPLKKAITEGVESGERLFIINIAQVKNLERGFIQGLNSAKLLVDRAEGALVLIGLNRDTLPMVKRYADTLQAADTEAEALKLLLPASVFRKDQFHVAVLGSDRYQDTAFAGVAHYLNRGVFDYYSNPMADLKRLEALAPLIVFMNAALGPTDIRHLRRRLAEANKTPTPTFFFVFGLPSYEPLMRAAVANEGFDDALSIPFRGTEITLTNMDMKLFRAHLGKKIEGVLDGFYLEQREKRKRFAK